jgi:glutaminase
VKGTPYLNPRRLQTLFLHSCARGDLVRVRELVARGAPVLRGDYDGRTGLHVCSAKSPETKDFLLRIGLDPYAEDRFGNIACPGYVSESSEDEGPPPRPLRLSLRATSREQMMLSVETAPAALQAGGPSFGTGRLTSDDSDRKMLESIRINPRTVLVSLDGDLSSIPSRLKRVGLTPPDLFFNPEMTIEAQHPSLAKALTGTLAIPDWESFVNTIETICTEVEQMEVRAQAAQYCHILSSANLQDFGVAVTTVDGQTLVRGNAPHKKISLQSVFKPFSYAIALEDLGFEQVEKKVSIEPSGRSFRDMALDSKGRPYNPMVNSGGLATSSMIFRGSHSQADRFSMFISVLKRCSCSCKSTLEEYEHHDDFGFSQGVFLGEMEGAFNRVMSIAHVLRGSGVLSEQESVERAVEFYFSLCSIMVDVRQASVLAACLANGGRNPFTLEQVFSEEVTRRVIVVMLSSGLAEYSGTHSFICGFPAKSGVSGLTIGVVNGICGIAVASAGLDQYGNSVKGNMFFSKIANAFRVHQFDIDLLATRYTRGTPLNRYLSENEELIVGDLLFAASRGDVWLVKELLARRIVDIDTCDYDGRTALHLAASEGRVEVVKVLIEYGASVSCRDRFGGTPKSDAIKFGHSELLQLLGKAEDLEKA